MDVRQCTCSNCHRGFKVHELIERKSSKYGVTITEKVCPYCGSISWSTEEDLDTLERFLYPTFYL